MFAALAFIAALLSTVTLIEAKPTRRLRTYSVSTATPTISANLRTMEVRKICLIYECCRS